MSSYPFKRRNLLKLSGTGLIGTSALVQLSAAEVQSKQKEDNVIYDWESGEKEGWQKN